MTRILVTHSLQSFPNVDCIITIMGRGVGGRGTCAELTTSHSQSSSLDLSRDRGTPRRDACFGRQQQEDFEVQRFRTFCVETGDVRTQAPAVRGFHDRVGRREDWRWFQWRGVSRSESFVSVAYVGICVGYRDMSADSSHGDRLPRVHRGGRHLPRACREVGISRSCLRSELTCFGRLMLWQ